MAKAKPRSRDFKTDEESDPSVTTSELFEPAPKAGSFDGAAEIGPDTVGTEYASVSGDDPRTEGYHETQSTQSWSDSRYVESANIEEAWQQSSGSDTEIETAPGPGGQWSWGAPQSTKDAYYATLQPGDFGATGTKYPQATGDTSGWASSEETDMQSPQDYRGYPVDPAEGMGLGGSRPRTWFGSGISQPAQPEQPAWASVSELQDPQQSVPYNYDGGTAYLPPEYYQPKPAPLQGTTISPTLSQRFIDSIPAGLDPANWDVNDPLATLRTLPDEQDSPLSTAFKLELDGLTAENLVSAAGTIVTASQGVYIVLPPYGPCVAGAQAFGVCDVVIDDPRVSRRHVMFEVVREGEEDVVYVTNTQSTNGVFRNSSPLRKWISQRLEVGDEIALGARAVARFRLYEADAGDIKVCSSVLIFPSDAAHLVFYHSALQPSG
jgi:hypothetical protein